MLYACTILFSIKLLNELNGNCMRALVLQKEHGELSPVEGIRWIPRAEARSGLGIDHPVCNGEESQLETG